MKLKSIKKTRAQESVELAASFAVESGLRYVTDDQPGFRRKRKGKSFVYLSGAGKPVTAVKTLARIKALVIPPAWEDVWICRYDNGHLQATGRDARGRKQYRYHAVWSQTRNQTKFEKLLVFGKALPKIRARLEQDLKLRGYPKNKVLAAVVRVMELTHIRVGNEAYVENDSYGLTTIRNDHAEVHGSKVKFKFRGKSGVHHDVGFADPRLSRIIQKCQDLPGEELFAYEDDEGVAHDVGSADVNEYLREISGESITAKDFRTWAGTTRALQFLATLGPSSEATKKARKSRETAVMKEAAMHLGNTVAVCRKYYVHPGIFDFDLRGELHRLFEDQQKRKPTPGGLSVAEEVAMRILKAPQILIEEE